MALLAHLGDATRALQQVLAHGLGLLTHVAIIESRRTRGQGLQASAATSTLRNLMFIQDFSAFMRGRLGRAYVVSLLASACVLGCGASDEESATYHARGVVLETNGKGSDLRVTIHHEAIEKF